MKMSITEKQKRIEWLKTKSEWFMRIMKVKGRKTAYTKQEEIEYDKKEYEQLINNKNGTEK